jgi:thiol-disulfide isomerase/thioredoxin
MKLRNAAPLLVVLALLGVLLWLANRPTELTDAPGEQPPVGLDVGLTAPPVQGADVNGRPVKLADYRGKVVLLDFWATWCGPCKALIPHEKKLVERYKGRPFAILGVSADYEPADLQQFLAHTPLPWSNIYDGPTGDDVGMKINRQWQIGAYPTFHLLDHRGIIRAKNVPPDELDRLIDRLVQEAEAGG